MALDAILCLSLPKLQQFHLPFLDFLTSAIDGKLFAFDSCLKP
jgi:hypothetical protein